LTSTPSVITDRADRISPKTSASAGRTRPDGMGRAEVRVITASISASYHMLSAPAAPAPTAIASTAMMDTNGLSEAGAATRPTKAVNTTSDMTRGFSSSK
jgi:hypothetical protein